VRAPKHLCIDVLGSKTHLLAGVLVDCSRLLCGVCLVVVEVEEVPVEIAYGELS
jgi:hypothetical protein